MVIESGSMSIHGSGGGAPVKVGGIAPDWDIISNEGMGVYARPGTNGLISNGFTGV